MLNDSQTAEFKDQIHKFVVSATMAAELAEIPVPVFALGSMRVATSAIGGMLASVPEGDRAKLREVFISDFTNAIDRAANKIGNDPAFQKAGSAFLTVGSTRQS